MNISTKLKEKNVTCSGSLVQEGKEAYYKIEGIENMEPFLMSVVSDSDLWMWVSSNGALTAGRIDADHAIFPYLTEDRIHKLVGYAGPVSLIMREEGETWQPFGTECLPECRRSLSKHVLGNEVIFEEYHEKWKLLYKSSWKPSARFGWVREVELINNGGEDVEVRIIDGLLDIMPAGLDAKIERDISNLADAYKRTESLEGIVIYTIESRITDKAEPSESLLATVAYSITPSVTSKRKLYLDERIITAIKKGSDHPPSAILVGRPGAYILDGQEILSPNHSSKWAMVIDTNLNHAQVHDRIEEINRLDIYQKVMKDVEKGSAYLSNLLRDADGYQKTGEKIIDAHHLSNVLYNSMRGGAFIYGYQISASDLLDFLEHRNKNIYLKHHLILKDQTQWNIIQLMSLADELRDSHLKRLLLEYLPISFSRRHGDPSRPWNRFHIHLHNKLGERILYYEGNWRDIFQNWESTLYSFPKFIPNVVAKFVNASTMDGYNPYRITRNSIDWEVLDPEDPWSNIGYWGDHQLVYLLRLLQTWERFEPQGILEWMNSPLFVYADIPYRLSSYSDMLKDPRNTVSYDKEREKNIKNKVEKIGSDGYLVVDKKGDIVQVGLLEKLLVPALAKFTCFVPDGGIWMNTQRPEWNDANNALAGYGLSCVTLCYLREYVTWLKSTLSSYISLLADGSKEIQISKTVAQWIKGQNEVMGKFKASITNEIDDKTRRSFMNEIGLLGENYRQTVYNDFEAEKIAMSILTIQDWCSLVLTCVDASIKTALLPTSGLCHSYNLVSFTEREATINHLPIMLEGQVAVLSSGILDSDQSIKLIKALFESDLYRQDQESFTLYPSRSLPAFMDKNVLSKDVLEKYPSVKEEEIKRALEKSILIKDKKDNLYFHPDAHNAKALSIMIGENDTDKEALIHIYEDVFKHHFFTGRSGSMHGYEGIGSIYWHMVGKLLLAVQECYWRAKDKGENKDTLDDLKNLYHKVRGGLGASKSPLDFGAIPTDCYSHTPSHSGAQQPGMTGQVKEGILCRIGELGIRIQDGIIDINPSLLSEKQYFSESEAAEFSFCGTKFKVFKGTKAGIEIEYSEGKREKIESSTIPRRISKEIFKRTGVIKSIHCVSPSD